MGHEDKPSSNNYVLSVLLMEPSARLTKTVYPQSHSKLYRLLLSAPECLVKNTQYVIYVLCVVEK
jgi:hypothetical protein